MLVIATTDHWSTQAGTVHLDLDALGVPGASGAGAWDDYEAIDLFGGERYRWSGAHNLVILDPNHHPVHVLRLRPAVDRTTGSTTDRTNEGVGA